MFNLQFFRLIKKKKNRHPKKLPCAFFAIRKVSTIISIEGAKSSPDHKITELLTFDNLFPRYDIFRAKTRTK